MSPLVAYDLLSYIFLSSLAVAVHNILSFVLMALFLNVHPIEDDMEEQQKKKHALC